MPAVADYNSGLVLEVWNTVDSGDYPHAQGDGGQQLRKKKQKALDDCTRIPRSRPYRWNHVNQIQQAIGESRSLLQLADNWDAEGSPAIKEDTWSRAVEFLKRHADSMLRSHEVEIDPPRIAPGPDGSIDLHWDYPEYELLINFPADASEMAQYYGDDRSKIWIKASFDPSTINEGLLSWLQRTI